MSPAEPSKTGTPFPTVGTALLLTFGAIVAGGLLGLLFIDLGPLAAEGLGTALGIGGVATLAARHVGDPQAQRLGFVPLEWRAWPLVLGLVPTILLASELDNFAYDGSAAASKAASAAIATAAAQKASPTDAATPTPAAEELPTSTDAPKDAAGSSDAKKVAKAEEEAEDEEPLIDRDDPFNVMEGLIVAVGIAPVIHEFLFRGVLQQGLVAQLGVARGVGLTALLWTMMRPVPSTDPGRFVAAFVAWLAMGWLLGMVRIATGSILGPILLASLWAAVGYGSFALEHVQPIPGMNVEGTHLPLPVTLASLAAVTWATLRVLDRARARAGERSG